MTFVHLNLFQLILLPIATMLFCRSIAGLTRGHHRRASALSSLVWLSAGITVLRPNITLALARILGIGRGTDLVLYVFVIAFLGAAFYFYNRVVRLEGAITILVRDAALRATASAEPQVSAKQTAGARELARSRPAIQAHR